jgi:sec-independent protein translocase protein TatA
MLSTVLTVPSGASSVVAVLFGMPGWMELLVIAFVGLLLFGRRLPEVGRSLGRSIVEFKKGVREARDEIESSTSAGGERPHSLPPRQPSQTIETPPTRDRAEKPVRNAQD